MQECSCVSIRVRKVIKKCLESKLMTLLYYGFTYMNRSKDFKILHEIFVYLTQRYY